MEAIKSMASVFNIYNLKSLQRHFFPLSHLRCQTRGQNGPSPGEDTKRTVFLLDGASELTFERLFAKCCFISDDTFFAERCFANAFVEASQNFKLLPDGRSRREIKKDNFPLLHHPPGEPSFKFLCISWISHLGFPIISYNVRTNGAWPRAVGTFNKSWSWHPGRKSPGHKARATSQGIKFLPNLFSMRLCFQVPFPTPPDTF